MNWSRLYQRIQQHTVARLGKNALALLAAQGGARLLSLLMVAQLLRSVGAAGLGRYLLAITVETVALAITDLGLNTLTVRELARERSPEQQERLWGTVLLLKAAAALVGLLLLNGLFAPLLFPGQRRVHIAIISLALLPEAYSTAVGALIRARQRMEIGSAVTLLARTLFTLGGMGLLRLGYDERAVLALYLLFAAIEAGALWAIVRRWRIKARWGPFGRLWRGTLGESIPFALAGIAGMLYRRLDLLILSYWQGDVAAGVYGTAYRLWEALGLFPVSLLDALFPEMSRQSAGAGGRARLRRLYGRGLLLLTAVAVLLVLTGYLLAPHVVPLLYGPSAGGDQASGIFRLLLLFLPFTYLYLLSGHALYAVGRQRLVTVAMVVVTALNGGLNLFLIPRWSYWGAVGVAGFSEVALFVILLLAVQRFILAPVGRGGDRATRRNHGR